MHHKKRALFQISRYSSESLLNGEIKISDKIFTIHLEKGQQTRGPQRHAVSQSSALQMLGLRLIGQCHDSENVRQRKKHPVYQPGRQPGKITGSEAMSRHGRTFTLLFYLNY